MMFWMCGWGKFGGIYVRFESWLVQSPHAVVPLLVQPLLMAVMIRTVPRRRLSETLTFSFVILILITQYGSFSLLSLVLYLLLLREPSPNDAR